MINLGNAIHNYVYIKAALNYYGLPEKYAAWAMSIDIECDRAKFTEWKAVVSGNNTSVTLTGPSENGPWEVLKTERY